MKKRCTKESDSVFSCSVQEAGGAGGGGGEQTPKTPTESLGSSRGVFQLPSAAVCVGVLPGLGVYSGSSDSESSSDSEGSVDAIISPYARHGRAYR